MPASQCSASNQVYNSLEAGAPVLQSGEVVHGYIGCSEYKYYTFDGEL